jgi:hypothetical protein
MADYLEVHALRIFSFGHHFSSWPFFIAYNESQVLRISLPNNAKSKLLVERPCTSWFGRERLGPRVTTCTERYLQSYMHTAMEVADLGDGSHRVQPARQITDALLSHNCNTLVGFVHRNVVDTISSCVCLL